MNKKPENVNELSHDRHCFAARCEGLNINPYKDRFFSADISRLTGYAKKTIQNTWAFNKGNSPFPLYKDAKGRVFAYRDDLIKFLDHKKRVGIKRVA